MAATSEVLALVGGESLIGREIRDILANSLPGQNLKLIASEESAAGILTEHAGEPAVLLKLHADEAPEYAAIILAGSPASSRKVLDLAAHPLLIDLTYAAEDQTNARLRAPMVEPAGYEVPAGATHVIAHPAAIAIALALGRIHIRFPVRRSVVHIFEPASERGKQGVDELHQQTINLLSFKGLPKEVFDAQLAFNLLASYGEEAQAVMENVELRIERHLATLLSISSRAPLPSTRLIQAPVFHGHSSSLWIEFENNPGAGALEQALSSDFIDVRPSDSEPPNVVGFAGQSGVAVGGIALDRNNTQACWAWMVADNVRLQAENAVEVARQVTSESK